MDTQDWQGCLKPIKHFTRQEHGLAKHIEHRAAKLQERIKRSSERKASVDTKVNAIWSVLVQVQGAEVSLKDVVPEHVRLTCAQLGKSLGNSCEKHKALQNKISEKLNKLNAEKQKLSCMSIYDETFYERKAARLKQARKSKVNKLIMAMAKDIHPEASLTYYADDQRLYVQAPIVEAKFSNQHSFVQALCEQGLYLLCGSVFIIVPEDTTNYRPEVDKDETYEYCNATGVIPCVSMYNYHCWGDFNTWDTSNVSDKIAVSYAVVMSPDFSDSEQRARYDESIVEAYQNMESLQFWDANKRERVELTYAEIKEIICKHCNASEKFRTKSCTNCHASNDASSYVDYDSSVYEDFCHYCVTVHNNCLGCKLL